MTYDVIYETGEINHSVPIDQLELLSTSGCYNNQSLNKDDNNNSHNHKFDVTNIWKFGLTVHLLFASLELIYFTLNLFIKFHHRNVIFFSLFLLSMNFMSSIITIFLFGFCLFIIVMIIKSSSNISIDEFVLNVISFLKLSWPIYYQLIIIIFIIFRLPFVALKK